MKGKKSKFLIAGALLLTLSGSYISNGILVFQEVYAQKAEAADLRDNFEVKKAEIDEEKQTVNWELTMTKAVSEVNEKKQMLVSLPAGLEVLSISDEKGESLDQDSAGRYLVGTNDTKAASCQVNLVTSLPVDDENQTLAFDPEIRSMKTTIDESPALGPNKLNSVTETYQIGTEESNRVDLETTGAKAEQSANPVDRSGLLRAEVTVSNWAQLKDAVENGTADVVNVTGFTNTSGDTAINVNRDVTVISKTSNALQATNIRRFNVIAGNHLTLQDFTISGAYTGYLVGVTGATAATLETTISLIGMTTTNYIANGAGIINGVNDAYNRTTVNLTNSQIFSNNNRITFAGISNLNFDGTNHLDFQANNNTMFDVRRKVNFAKNSEVKVTSTSVAGAANVVILLADAAEVVFEGSANLSLNRSRIGQLTETRRTPDFTPFFASTGKISFTQTDTSSPVNLNLISGVFVRTKESEVDFSDVNIRFDVNYDTTISSSNASASDNALLAKAMPLVRFIEAKTAKISNSNFTSTEGYAFAFYFTEVDYSELNIDTSTIQLDGLKSSVTNGRSSIPSMIHFYGNEDAGGGSYQYRHRSSNLIIDNSKVDLRSVSYNNQMDGTTNLYRTGVILHEHSEIKATAETDPVPSKIEVVGGSVVTVYNPETSGIATRGTGTQFNISNGSTLEVTGGSKIAEGMNESDAHRYMAAIRMFGHHTRYGIAKGEYEFNITGGSTLRANKLAGARQSAAMRIGGTSNVVNVSGNSVFQLINEGDGNNTPTDPADTGDYIALQYDNIPGGDTGAAVFNVGTNGAKDNSKVEILAYSGMGVFGGAVTSSGVTATNPTLKVFAYEDSEFIVRGNTTTNGRSGTKYGVFGLRATQPKFDLYMNRPRYYEFENYNKYGILVNANNSANKFEVKNAYTMVWSNATATAPDHDASPTYTLGRLDYTLTGNNFTATSGSSGYEFFRNGINQYSYIKAQGMIGAQVNAFHQVTNADDKIYGQLVVARRDGNGDAEIVNDQIVYENLVNSSTSEAGVFIEYTNSQGTLIRKFVKVMPVEAAWGDATKETDFCLDLGTEKLPPGTRIRIIGSWDRNNYQPGDPEYSTPADADFGKFGTVGQAPGVSFNQDVIDVLAPTVTATLTLGSSGLTNATISGTTEPNTKVYLLQKPKSQNITYPANVNTLTSATADSTGTWSVTGNFSNATKVYVYGADQSTITTAQANNVPGGLPKAYVLGTANKAAHGTWDSREGNLTVDHFIDQNLEDPTADANKNVVAYHAVDELPRAAYVNVQTENRLPELKIKAESADTYATTATKVVDYGSPVSFYLNGVDGDSNDYIRQLVIKYGTETILTKNYVSGEWPAPDNQITLSAQELIDAEIYKDYGKGDKVLTAYIYSTNGSGSGEFHNQKSNEVTLTLSVKGTLTILSVPSDIDFGVKEVGTSALRVNDPTYTGDLIIWDNRSVRTGWSLNAQLEEELTNQSDTSKFIPNAIRYRKTAGVASSEFALTSSAQEVVSHTQSQDQFNVTDAWRTTDTGFRLDVPAGAVKGIGKYQAVIKWTLSDVPSGG